MKLKPRVIGNNRKNIPAPVKEEKPILPEVEVEEVEEIELKDPDDGEGEG
jgi:hypothetical protein